MTALQHFLRNRGTIQQLATAYAIKAVRHKTYPNLVLFKYSQIASDMSLPIVQESRGIILDEDDDWRIVSRSYDKFFNYGEPNAAKIDWATAQVQEKVDGSLCTLYHYRDAWHVATTGSPDASGPVNSSMGTTFANLFWQTWQRHGVPANLPAQTELSLLFELTTPHNRVVVCHQEASLTLLAARSPWYGSYQTVRGCRLSNYVPTVREYWLQSFEDIMATFDGMNPLAQEGYVVVDNAGHRVKVKHPGYVALHHMKDGMTPKSMVTVIQRGEVPEVISSFPELAAEFTAIKTRYEALATAIDEQYAQIAHILTPKAFVECALRSPLSAALFNIRAKKCSDGRDFLAKATVSCAMNLLSVKEDVPAE